MIYTEQNVADLDATALRKLSKDVRKMGAGLSRDSVRSIVDLYYQLQRARITSGNIIRSEAGLYESTVEGERSDCADGTEEVERAPITEGTAHAERAAEFDSADREELAGEDESAMIDERAGLHESSEALERPALMSWILAQFEGTEKRIVPAMDEFSDGYEVGRWSKSICGIGPVLAAGLLAHIDIDRAPTAGCIWRFAGLDPTVKWAKGQKRPFNARLKVLCWKIGDSFVKTSGNKNSVYGHLYRERKAFEVARNDSGQLADQAKAAVDSGRRLTANMRKSYDAGRLPDGRIDLRARRYAVKLFLAHWHHVAFQERFGMLPPRPYVIEHLGHAKFMGPPNWPMP